MPKRSGKLSGGDDGIRTSARWLQRRHDLRGRMPMHDDGRDGTTVRRDVRTEVGDVELSTWFLTAEERGNAATAIDRRHPAPWTEGNLCRPLVHGRRYFARLYEELAALQPGDTVCFTDWRGDPDERLAGPGSEAAALLRLLAARGVVVRGLVWRSHPHQARFSEKENLHFAHDVNQAGGEVFADERVRRGGSHHQKLFVIRHPSRGDEDVAFVGGIDMAHGRNDDADHRGDPQAIAIDRRYGPTPAWHDLQLELRGPVIGDLEYTFRERWDDPLPVVRGPWGRRLAHLAHEPERPARFPPQTPDPAAVGPTPHRLCARIHRSVRPIRSLPAASGASRGPTSKHSRGRGA